MATTVTIAPERAANVLGVEGTFSPRVAFSDWRDTWMQQSFSAVRETATHRCTILLRLDDCMHAGVNTFYMTLVLRELNSPHHRIRSRLAEDSLGRFFPELLHLHRWLNMSREGSRHYFTGTLQAAREARIYHHLCKKTQDTRAKIDASLVYMRATALWPDATNEDLLQPESRLLVALKRRLPTIIAEFEKDMTALGFQLLAPPVPETALCQL